MPDENPLLATLPEDIRNEPSLATIRDVGSLAKGYVHAQKLIGSKRLVAPADSWGESQWSEFFDAVGRPKTSTEYEIPTIEGMDPDLKIDDTKKTVAFAHLHKLGLTKKQASGVMEYYMRSTNDSLKGMKTTAQAEKDAGTVSLRQEWGDKFDANVDIARSVIKKFGGDRVGEIAKWLDTSGMGNNANLAKLLHTIGMTFQEDHKRGGGAGDLPMGDQARATSEIGQLTLDLEFQKALGDARHMGHRAAVDRWTNLHAVAYPGKSD